MAKRWLALIEVCAYSAKETPIRPSSRASLLNARTTRTPVMFSSSTVVMRSSSFCRRWNKGEALRMIKNASTRTASTTPSRIKPISVSSRKASASATMKITGTGSTIWMKLVSANWMVVISDTVRVVMDAVPNCRKS